MTLPVHRVCRTARRLIRGTLALAFPWLKPGDTREVNWLDDIEPDELAG